MDEFVSVDLSFHVNQLDSEEDQIYAGEKKAERFKGSFGVGWVVAYRSEADYQVVDHNCVEDSDSKGGKFYGGFRTKCYDDCLNQINDLKIG